MMLDALGLLAARGIKPIRIERASDKPGATGFVLDRGKFYRLPDTSDALPRASSAPSGPTVEVGRVTHRVRAERGFGERVWGRP